MYRVLGDDDADSAARMPVEDERKTRMMDRAFLATLRRSPQLTRRLVKRVGA